MASDQQKAALKEITDRGPITLTPKSDFVTEVWTAWAENPFYSDLPKPTVKYLFNFLDGLPSLRSLCRIEKREYLLNIAILGYIRDLLTSTLAKSSLDNSKWMDDFPAKYLRILIQAIEKQSEIIPKVFEDPGADIRERIASGKILRTIQERTIEIIDSPDESNIIDVEVPEDEPNKVDD